MVLESNTLDVLFVKDGQQGEDGKVLYTWIKYAKDANGTGMTDDPNGAIYIGISYNNESSIESNDPTQYAWTKIQGADGKKGEDAYTIFLENENISFATDKNRNPLSEQAYTSGITIMKGAKPVTDFAIGNIAKTQGIAVAKTDTAIAISVVNGNPLPSDSGEIEIPITVGSTVFKKILTWTCAKKGDQGEKGERGLQGIQGPQGEQGIAGKDGTSVTITNKSITYQLSTSGTTIPTGTWQTTPQAIPEGQYQWTKTSVTYSDGNKTESYSISYHGKNGSDGTSVKTTSTSVKYQVGDSGTTKPTGTWQSNVPTVAQGKYLWTQTIVNYSDGNSTESYSVSYKGIDGSNGVNGMNAATIYLYQRATSTPSKPSNTLTYTFSTTKISGTLNNGWSTAIPTGTDAVYVTVASVSSKNDTATIATSAWSAPVVLAQNGKTGSDGKAGLNVATIYLYQRNTSKPSKPSASVTYTFSTGVASGLNNGWSQKIPDGTNPLYVTLATASSNTATDTILSSEWSDVVVMAQNGEDGISPKVSLSKSGDTTTISIVDATGTHTQTVKDGTNGTPGAAGKDGKTSYFHVKYSNDGGKTFTANSGEDTGIYMGSYTDYTEADSTDVKKYNWVKVKGDKGDTGQKGKDGTSIKITSKSVTYQTSTSGTTAPTGTWSTTVPTVNNGQYLWTKTTVQYSDGNKTEAYSVSYKGTNGTNGTSVTVSKTEVTYQVSTSGTTAPTGTWSTTMPSCDQGQYLWTKTYVKYSDGKETTSYSVSYKGVDGEKFAFNMLRETNQGSKHWENHASGGKYSTESIITEDGINAVKLICTEAIPSDGWQYVSFDDYQMLKSLKPSTDYVISFDIKSNLGTQGPWVSIQQGDSTNAMLPAAMTHIKGNETWEHIRVFLRSNDTLPKINGQYIYITSLGGVGYSIIKNLKLTESTTDTPWAPHPEDLEGRGVSETVQYYLATSQASGVTSSTSSWSTDITTQKLTADKKYLWNCYQTKYSDGTSEPISTPKVIGVYGDKGQKGDTGEDGAGFHWNLLKRSGDLAQMWYGEVGGFTKAITYTTDTAVPSNNVLNCRVLTVGTNGGMYIPAGAYMQAGDIKKGNTYTVSVWCKCSSAKDIGIMNVEFLNQTSSAIPKLSTEWQQYIITGVANKDVTDSTGGSAITFYYGDKIAVGDILYISSPKVEEGDKASPWCTTYEETLAKNLSITPSSQYFKSTDGGKTFAPNTITIKPTIQGEISFGKWQYSIDGGVSFADVVSGQKGLTVSNNVLAVSKDSSLYSDAVTMVTFRAVANDSSFYDTCSIAKIYDVSDIGDGRNLLWNSNFAKTDEAINTSTYTTWGLILRGSTYTATIDTSVKHNNFNTLKVIGTKAGDSGGQDLIYRIKGLNLDEVKFTETDVKYTLSFYAKASIACNFSARYAYDSYAKDTNVALSTDWKRYEIQMHPTTTSYQTFLIFKMDAASNVWFSEFKLEKGSSATGYSTAPEDVQVAILSTKSEISDVSLKVDKNKQAIEQRVEKTTYQQDLNLVKGDISKANEGLNKWRYEIYPKSLFADKLEDQSKYDIGVFIRNKNLTPSQSVLLDDASLSTGMDYGDSHIAYGLTFIKMSAAKSITTTFYNDDGASFYVNGKLIISRTSEYTNGQEITFTLVQGWNCLEVVLNEVGGSEGFRFSTTLSALSECQLMNCYYGTPVARQSHITNQLVQNTTDIGGISGSVQQVMSAVGGSDKVDEFVNNYSTWKKKVDDIETRVGKTYVTKNDFDGLEIGGVNLFVKSTASRGWWISDTGVLNANGGWGYSDYINVSGMKNYIASGFTNLGISPATCFYDSNKTFISGVQSTNQNSQDSKRKTLPIPSNAKYMRFSFMLVDIDTLKIEQGTKATAYSPAPEDDEINGQNLVSNLPSNWEQGTVTEGSTTGTTYANTKSSSAGSVRPKELIPVSGNITISTAYSNQSKKPIRHWIAAYDVNKNYLGNNYVSNAWNSFPRTLNMKDAKYIAIMVGYTDSSAITPSDISQICLKIERGTSATPFTLAPEDVNGKIVNVETIANQTAKKFEWIVKGGDSSSNFTLTDRVADLVAERINFKGLVTFSGTTNLIENSNMMNGLANITSECKAIKVIDDSTYRKALVITPIAGGKIFWGVANVWKANITYTVSFVAKSSVAGQKIKPSRSVADWGDEITLTTSYVKYTTRIKSTATADGGTLSFSFSNAIGDVTLTNVKLETGMNPTDWSPAPGDYITQASLVRNWTTNTTWINGGKIYTGSITADKIATDAIKSRNYISSGGTQGSFLNLSDGSFQSPNLSWDANGNLIAKNANLSGEIAATKGTIGGWNIKDSLYSNVREPYDINKYYAKKILNKPSFRNICMNTNVLSAANYGTVSGDHVTVGDSIIATNTAYSFGVNISLGRISLFGSTYYTSDLASELNKSSSLTLSGDKISFWEYDEDGYEISEQNNTYITSNYARFSGDIFIDGGIGTDGDVDIGGKLQASSIAAKNGGLIETSGTIYGGGEIQCGGDQVRIISGNIGCMLRNDSADFYILRTSSRDPYGGWTNDRPFRINWASNDITCGHNLTANDLIANSWVYCSEVHSSGAVVIASNSESYYWAHGYQMARGTSWGGVCIGDDSQGLRLYGTSIWASHSISTSDENLKENFTTLDQYEDFYMNLNPIGFNYIGDYDGKKTHFGFGAHKTEDILESEGYDSDKFAVVTHRPLVQEDIEKRFGKDVEVDIETEYGVSYTEFIALNTHMIQKTRKELEQVKQEKTDLEARLQAIEAKLGL